MTKRPWRIYVETASRMASHPMPGYAYSTKARAEEGIRRLVREGELIDEIDKIVTPGLRLRVHVGHDGS